MDSNILEATKANLTQQRNRFWVQGDPGAVLPIEFYGSDDAELEQRCAALIADLQAAGYGYAFPLLKHDQVKHCWDLRRAGLGLLMGIPGDKKSMPLLEDAAVAVEDLPAYVEAVQAIMARHKLNIVYYAHASVGLLHIRPQIDLKQASQVALFEQLGHEVFKVVQSFGGSISGEHGDGRLRAPFIKELFGEECYDLFRQVKHVFDPKNIFNPHKIVDPLPMTSDLRYVPDYQTPEIETVFDWSADQGLVRATEKCNGAGACRKSPGRGTMCPSYHATLEEKHSTRGRANIFRQALKADDPRSAFSDPQLEEVLDLCLSCKACKSECPASVDMGRLKAEFFQQKYQNQRPPLRTRLFANFSQQARFATRLPRWMQGMMNLPLAKRLIGIHPQRSMPPFSRLRFADWITKRAPVALEAGQSEVVLFVDEFSQYLDAAMLRDAVLLLERLGFHVHALWDIDSGRAALSKGFVTAARGHLQDCVEKLYVFAQRGLPIIGLEPSAILGLRDEALDLMPDADSRAAAQLVAQCSVTLEEFLIARASDLDVTDWQAPAAEVLVHEHCHAKALLGAGITQRALQLFPGWKIKLINAGCCGMAGSFGYEKEHYAVSMTIGEQLLFPAVRAAQAETLLCAPGTSCRHQILDGTQREALHPAQILLRGFTGVDK